MKTLITLTILCFFVTIAHAQVTKPAVKKTPAKPVTTNRTATIRKKVIPIPGVRVKITTDSGVIVIRLYDKTPMHRDNFIKLVKEHFFDSLIFHRVISQFMIQGGDPQSKYAEPGQRLGMGDVGYTIPAEFDTGFIHKKGALAAARMPDQVNPAKASSGCQFYIVQGKQLSDAELNMWEMRKGIKYSAQQRSIYKTIGGTPLLDMDYTIFGEVESGLAVIDKIAGVIKDGNDRPFGNVRMRIEVIK